MSEATIPPIDRALAAEETGTAKWSWNIATGAVTWTTGVGAVLFGITARELISGMSFEDYLALVHPEDRAHFKAVIARTLAGEDEYVMSHRVIWPDGSVRWIDGRGQLTRDPDGKPLVLSGVAWSATARKSAEARMTHLRRVQAVTNAVSRQLLRVEREEDAFSLACRIAVEHGHFRFAWIGLLTDEQVAPVARAGVEDGYLDEPAVDCTLTPSGSGPVGRSIREEQPVVVNDIGTDPTFAPWRDLAFQRGYRACGSFPLRRAGRIVGVLVIYAEEANRFDADQLELLRGLADDIGFKLDTLDAEGRRHAAEEAVRRSEEKYRALVEGAADAIFVTDSKGIILEVNPAAEEVSGLSREEMVGKTMSQAMKSPHSPVARKLANLPPGTRVTDEQVVRRKDGSLIVTEVHGVKLADGRILGYARDTTQSKNAQRQLILADRLASLGRLAAGVAHEINNPLAYVMLNLERIERAANSGVSPAILADIRAAVADALEGAGRVRSIVRSLGAFSREEGGEVGAVDLWRVLDNAVRMSESAARHRGKVVCTYGSTRHVRGTDLRLGQVFLNLLVNAADALKEDSTEQGRIDIRTYDEGDYVIVEVSDNGNGIAPEHVERIFDPFFTTKAVGEGTGLGLSISHGIVTSFGGKIRVESKLGTGTTFRVSLLAEDEAPKAGALPQGGAQNRARILVIDDEPRLAQTLATLLQEHAVTVATSGHQALELMQRHVYDAILCDLMMAGVSGMDLYAELVRQGRGVERRIVFMTGGAYTTRALDFLASIQNVLLEKPFTPDQVEEAIAAVLEAEGRVKN